MQKTVNLEGIRLSELERAYDKMHAWFFAYPQHEVTLNELVKNLEISKTTANIVVIQLQREGFLDIRKLGKVWRISANQNHRYFITRKIPFNLKLVYESGIVEWIKSKILNVQSIILFGSYRKGDDTDKSDLDIAVEVVGNKTGILQQSIIEDVNKIHPVIIKNLGYRRNVKVSIHPFSRNHIDHNLFASIANGIILMGFLEVKP